jgi:hypothetical protein
VSTIDRSPPLQHALSQMTPVRILEPCSVTSVLELLSDVRLDLFRVCQSQFCRGQLKRDGTRAETRFRLSAKRTSPFKSAGASVQSTAGSRGACISGSNAGYTMFRGGVKA